MMSVVLTQMYFYISSAGNVFRSQQTTRTLKIMKMVRRTRVALKMKGRRRKITFEEEEEEEEEKEEEDNYSDSSDTICMSSDSETEV